MQSINDGGSCSVSAGSGRAMVMVNVDLVRLRPSNPVYVCKMYYASQTLASLSTPRTCQSTKSATVYLRP